MKIKRSLGIFAMLLLFNCYAAASISTPMPMPTSTVGWGQTGYVDSIYRISESQVLIKISDSTNVNSCKLAGGSVQGFNYIINNDTLKFTNLFETALTNNFAVKIYSNGCTDTHWADTSFNTVSHVILTR